MHEEEDQSRQAEDDLIVKDRDGESIENQNQNQFQFQDQTQNHNLLPRPGGPLKPRVDIVQKMILEQTCKLEQLCAGLRSADDRIFKTLVTSVRENNTQYSCILSSDLAKSRRMTAVAMMSKVSFEKLQAKFAAVSGLGDLVIVAGPAMAVVKSICSSIVQYMPEMESEMKAISEVLSGILVDAGQVGGYTINFESANEEAAKIIQESSAAAEKEMRQCFSELPAELVAK
jgi:division protein CdvB (Snf7/Vps24/ESCRT-III family)